MAKFCKECGSPIEAGERFCHNCGTMIAAAAAPQDPAPADTARQQTSQPHSNPKPYQSQPQGQQHVYEDAYADEKTQGVDWKQLKPKLTIGKPQVTFISKGKLIFVVIILIIIILAALLQGCGTVKETTDNSQTTSKSPNVAKITTNKPTSSTLLKSTSTNGVKSFTLFDVDSKSLTSSETKQLDALAREIKTVGSCYVTVIGHADNTGTSEVNEAVSAKRARLVADYLKKKGVSNITSSGESYNHPIAGNDTAAGRAKNRRVEIYVSTIGRYNPYK